MTWHSVRWCRLEWAICYQYSEASQDAIKLLYKISCVTPWMECRLSSGKMPTQAFVKPVNPLNWWGFNRTLKMVDTNRQKLNRLFQTSPEPPKPRYIAYRRYRMFFKISKKCHFCSFVPYTISIFHIPQGCISCASLATWLWENGERMRKWKGNGERMRKWSENEQIERDSLFIFPHFLFISSLSIHFLSKIVTFCRITFKKC